MFVMETLFVEETLNALLRITSPFARANPVIMVIHKWAVRGSSVKLVSTVLMIKCVRTLCARYLALSKTHVDKMLSVLQKVINRYVKVHLWLFI